MGRAVKRLGARFVETTKTPGMHADGDGLYLVVGDASPPSKRWTFIFQWHGRRREMGLGSFPDRSLGEARDAATDARRLVAKGIDPIASRKADRAAQLSRDVLFGDFADALLEDIQGQFRSEKTVAQWELTLRFYCEPIRKMRLDVIETEDVLGVLKPIWQSKPETASRVRSRIERVLDAAKVKGHRSGENPARWRGHLDKLLARRQTLTRGHHAAVPYGELPALMERLRGVQGIGAQALRFTVLTVKRTGEVVYARWPEFDLKAKQWVIPPERTKTGREHREPLTDAALEILYALHGVRTDDWVFPGFIKDRPISTGTMAKALGLAGGAAFTVHGMRSSFRDWVGEETNFPDRLAEAALSHIVGDEVERAYRRGDALEKRRRLMEAWAGYLRQPRSQNIVTLARAAT